MHHHLFELFALAGLFLVIPALMVLHYVTKWKTAPRLTNDDEALLEELYQLARRLEDRVDTVERLVASEHPDFRPARFERDRDLDPPVAELDRMRARRERTAR